MSYNEPDDDGPDPLDTMSAVAHSVACFGVAFAAFVYGLTELGVL